MTCQVQQLLLLSMARLPTLSASYWGHLGKESWVFEENSTRDKLMGVSTRKSHPDCLLASMSRPSRRPRDCHG